ncbi:MAG: hypothetical protein DWQ05_11785 [Calditrichaeota bacterium]|nr:MAG: hypothetical protein DWQ05_11785 [Calditrichota bacterium]
MLPILQKLAFSKSLQNYATPPGFKYLDFQCYNHVIPPGLKKLICFVMLQNPGGCNDYNSVNSKKPGNPGGVAYSPLAELIG